MRCVEVEGTRVKGYGYTRVTVGHLSQRGLYAHRVAFEQAWGITLRADQVVRHTCDNPGCVNVLHLMVGTQGDNMDDMNGRGRGFGAMQRAKTHCPQGHEYTAENTYARDNGRARQCKPCTIARSRARRAQKVVGT